MVSAVTAVVSKPTAVPEMMFVAGPVLEASAISLTGRQPPDGVVLRDVDEGDAGDEADDAGKEEPDPGRDAVGGRCVGAGVHHDRMVEIARPTTDRAVVTQ